MLSFISLVLLGSAVALFLTGCLVVPDHVLVVSGSGANVLERSASICGSFDGNETSDEVDPDGFSILSWNSHKGSHAGWNSDLNSHAEKIDFILLQEAALDSGLQEQLRLLDRQWLLAVAFELSEKEIGIMTASRVPPQGYCALRENESLIKLPKMILAAKYPIRGLDSELLVINAHIVNFTFGSDLVRHQVAAVKEKIRSHRGPVIVAGDFNTWSGEREKVIHEDMQELGLQPVLFTPDNRVEFFGRIVDGIFSRGLEVTDSRSFRVETSDHNPLEVHFRITEKQIN